MSAFDRLTRERRGLSVTNDELHVRNAGVTTSLRRFMTTDNTATGAREMAVAGTLGEPIRFRVGPPAGQRWGVTTVVAAISDDATFNQNDFGGIAGGLTNGLALFLRSNGVDVELYGGFRVKRNYDWFAVPARATLTTWAGTAQTLEASFNIFQDSGQYAILDGDKGEELVVSIQDNLTSLVAMRAVARYLVL